MSRLIACVCATVLLAFPFEALAEFTVGYSTKTVFYWTPSGLRAVPVAMWYPSSGDTETRKFRWLRSDVVLNGPIEPGPWPLVVVSHGIYECGVASVFLTQSLAAAGAIVMAPDHEDAARCHTIGRPTRPVPYNLLAPIEESFPFRTSDVRATIDYALLRYPVTTVSLAGHSLGAETVLATADARVAGMLLWSVSPRLPAGTYASASTPVVLMYGAKERFSDTLWKTWPFQNLPVPAYQEIVPAAGHFEFTDRGRCRSWRTLEACMNAAAVPRRIRDISVAWLKVAGYQNPEALASLRSLRSVRE